MGTRALVASRVVRGVPPMLIELANTERVALAGENPTRRRPSGGSGGAGGNVYAIADEGLETLDSQLHHFNGQPGNPGGGMYCFN